MRLSKRLNTCLNYTKGFNKLADIGTDHARLPIEAIEEGYVSSALAIDNKIGPFKIAYDNVIKHKLQKQINVLLSDGLEKIDVNVDVVVISGMGGSLIADILLKHSLRNVKRLILQPNNDANIVRESLNKIEYHIIDELIINEKNKLYDIIVIEPGKAEYNKLQIQFGPINLLQKSRFFKVRIKREIARLDKLLKIVTLTERRISIKAEIMLLEEAMK